MMIKYISTLGFAVITLTTYSQNWMNDVQIQSRGNQSNVQRSTDRGGNIQSRGNRGNTNKMVRPVNRVDDNIGGLNFNNSLPTQSIMNTSLNNTRNVENNRPQSTTSPQGERNTINLPVQQKRVNQVQQRAEANPQQFQNPINVSPENFVFNQRGNINNANEDNLDSPKQLLNENNNFSNTKIINQEQKFEVKVVQKKEELNIPKPVLDLSLSLKVKTENSVVVEKVKSEKITIAKMGKSENSQTKRKSSKHAFYSQNNKSYLGMKIKNWYKRNFKSNRKIRVSVSCPSF